MINATINQAFEKKWKVTSRQSIDEIPCDLCEYVAKSIFDYDKHAKSKHVDQSKSSKPANEKNTSNSKETGVKIPCDLCQFTSASADDFIKHIETKHQKNVKVSKQTQYECGKCDFKANEEVNFKKHLEMAHRLNVGGWKTVNRGKSNNLCIYWNRGHCNYDLDCKFEHREITACLFKERCSRPDCKYWHAAQTGKYPFLDHRNSQNLTPRRPFQRRN